MTDPEETVPAIGTKAWELYLMEKEYQKQYGNGTQFIGVDTTSVIEGCRGSAKTAAYIALNFGIDIYEGHGG